MISYFDSGKVGEGGSLWQSIVEVDKPKKKMDLFYIIC